ncbi:intraflagellar transport protein 81 homolog isoform X2 [Solenopsis invicta]|uniref:intraflagellar transport protein 81 homolog isoform X2 n=1 Tax=Solenopsis invicta TaxID=13686 RepID=UPI000E33D602|nr:intraflagellar transport protein 81 homolog isoform X2 [Solenopsis invicta]XP_039312271.1 intraflagellar transport protein 81 homolog isoform X2 [Solenopsis invicta]XP_039312272.1 intraflagellar transport protein 81 homolog isoform X2 [Solenopsis invicta]
MLIKFYGLQLCNDLTFPRTRRRDFVRTKTRRSPKELDAWLMLEIPSEYLGDSEISLLHEQYLSLVDRFKTVHKEREIGKKNVETTVELATDLQAMTKEKEAVIARIGKIKSKAEPALHLLDTCRLLRMERDKERDLISQKELEEETISDLQNSLQRVERELYTLKRDNTGLTPQILIQHLTEEVTVQSAIVKEKLPSELNAKKNRMRALTIIKDYSYLGPDKIVTMRNDLDMVLKDIQDLVESKISKNDIDKMGPFRQQAAAVGNMKRNALERLEKIESSLEELQSRLKEKQNHSKVLLETSVPRAEELKKYINRLKTKSTLYKRCKAEIAGLKAESGVLQRTATILDGQIAHSYSMNIPSKVIIPENYTLDHALAMNTQLSHSILALRTNLTPIIKDMKALRQTVRETDERYQKACKSHNTVEMSMKNTTSDLLSETKHLKDKLLQDNEDKKRLQQKISKIKITEERLRKEAEMHNGFNNLGQTLKRELHNMIMKEEEILRNLNKEQDKLKEHTVQYENKTQQWNHIISIFSCKIQCEEESKQIDDIVVRKGGAETLVLQ